MSRVFTAEEKAKLTQLINEGMTVLQEVEDLNAGLSDTIKAVAEEMQVKPTIIKKAIKVAMKGDFQAHSEDHETLETILATIGKV